MDLIYEIAIDCAEIALEQGATARALAWGEDAPPDDYVWLDDILGRSPTTDERRAFRAAYSARLAAGAK